MERKKEGESGKNKGRKKKGKQKKRESQFSNKLLFHCDSFL